MHVFDSVSLVQFRKGYRRVVDIQTKLYVNYQECLYRFKHVGKVQGKHFEEYLNCKQFLFFSFRKSIITLWYYNRYNCSYSIETFLKKICKQFYHLHGSQDTYWLTGLFFKDQSPLSWIDKTFLSSHGIYFVSVKEKHARIVIWLFFPPQSGKLLFPIKKK